MLAKHSHLKYLRVVSTPRNSVPAQALTTLHVNPSWHTMENRTIELSTKPGAKLHLSALFPTAEESGSLSTTLVVFVNGLGLPRAGWTATVSQFIAARKLSGLPIPPLLSYDRYGQGDSDLDLTDPPDTPYGHDAKAVIADLHQLLTQVVQDNLGVPLTDIRLVLVANSIGCPLSRLYSGEHPGSIGGLIFLDSMVANTDFVSMFPDPDASSFDASQLPKGVSVDDLRQTRKTIAKVFHPTVPNKERFDRRNMPERLPHPDTPALPAGPDGKAPRLVVAGHDWDTFTDETLKVLARQLAPRLPLVAGLSAP